MIDAASAPTSTVLLKTGIGEAYLGSAGRYLGETRWGLSAHAGRRKQCPDGVGNRDRFAAGPIDINVHPVPERGDRLRLVGGAFPGGPEHAEPIGDAAEIGRA